MGGFSNFAISFSIISILTGAVTLYGHGLVMGGPAEMAFGWPLVTLLHAGRRSEHGGARVVAADVRRDVSLGVAARGQGLGLVHRVVQHRGPARGARRHRLRLRAVRDAAARAADDDRARAAGLCRDPAVARAHQSLRHPAGGVAQRLQRDGAHRRRDRHRRRADAVRAETAAGFFFARVTFNDQGWPYWWAFVIGLLQAQWTFTGYDASASVSEETVDPRRRAPWGIVMAVAVSASSATLLLLALTLAITGHPRGVERARRGGQQGAGGHRHLLGALGARAGSLFTALAAMAMWFCGLSAVTWSSRTIYAFARDNGLPGSRLWKQRQRQAPDPGSGDLAVRRHRLPRDDQQRRLRGRDLDQRDRALLFLHHSRVPRVACARARHCERPARPVASRPVRARRSTSSPCCGSSSSRSILSLPDNMRAGKSIGAVTAAARRVVSRDASGIAFMGRPGRRAI